MLAPTSQAIGRLTSSQCLINCRSSLPFTLRRVGILYNFSQILTRCYANPRPVSRPKAHTGRTTSTRKPKAAAAPKTTAKPKASAKKPTGTRKKPASKKATVTPRKTAKAKVKPKKSGRKALTEKQKANKTAKKKRSDVKALKEIALKPPTAKAKTAYLVYNIEHTKGQKIQSGELGPRAKSLAADFKNLSTERREHYNHVANQNKAASLVQYRQWIESHTPGVIHKANSARELLRRKGVAGRWTRLQDDREVKKPRTCFISFSVDRRASGDFVGIPLPDAQKRIGQEWKELSAAEKKPYFDRQDVDMARYDQEIKTVYNRDVKHAKRTAT